jgi:hypothetical protein
MTHETRCYGLVLEWAWLGSQFIVFKCYVLKRYRRTWRRR